MKISNIQFKIIVKPKLISPSIINQNHLFSLNIKNSSRDKKVQLFHSKCTSDANMESYHQFSEIHFDKQKDTMNQIINPFSDKKEFRQYSFIKHNSKNEN